MDPPDKDPDTLKVSGYPIRPRSTTNWLTTKAYVYVLPIQRSTRLQVRKKHTKKLEKKKKMNILKHKKSHKYFQ